MKLFMGFLILLFGANSAFAEEPHLHEMISISLGMVNVSVTENASTLSSTGTDSNETTASSTSASVISIDAVYEFLTYTDKAYFIKLTAPMVSSDGSGFFLGGAGANFYFNSLSSMFSYADEGSRVTITPTFRYYVGGTAGLGYIVYNTETAKKSDLLFDLQLQGGAIYNFKKKWGMRGELGISRGTGVASSTIGIKLFIGVNFFLEK